MAEKEDLLRLIQDYGGEVTQLQVVVTTWITEIVNTHEELRVILLRAIEESLESAHHLSEREITALNEFKNLLEKRG